MAGCHRASRPMVYLWFPFCGGRQRKYGRKWQEIWAYRVKQPTNQIPKCEDVHLGISMRIQCNLLSSDIHGLSKGLLRSNPDMAKRQDSVRIPRSGGALQNASAVENLQLLRGNHPTHCGRVAGSSCSPVLAATQLPRRANLTIMKKLAE